MKNYSEEIILSGAWVIAIGTIITAIGQTGETTVGSPEGERLVVKGNAIEAVGNSFQALGNTALFLEEREQSQIDSIIGCWLQTAGNGTNAVATEIEIHVSETDGYKLNAVGSGVQGLGAVYEAIGAMEGNSQTRNLEITGNSLVALGAFLDAAGNVLLLNNLGALGDRLSLLGSWIQVIGACTEVIALSNPPTMVTPLQNSDVYPYSGFGASTLI